MGNPAPEGDKFNAYIIILLTALTLSATVTALPDSVPNWLRFSLFVTGASFGLLAIAKLLRQTKVGAVVNAVREICIRDVREVRQKARWQSNVLPLMDGPRVTLLLRTPERSEKPLQGFAEVHGPSGKFTSIPLSAPPRERRTINGREFTIEKRDSLEVVFPDDFHPALHSGLKWGAYRVRWNLEGVRRTPSDKFYVGLRPESTLAVFWYRVRMQMREDTKN